MLVPKHTKLNDKERKDILAKHLISVQDLPRIKLSDPAIEDLEVNEGDIIKIIRKSVSAGEAVFYRRVVK